MTDDTTITLTRRITALEIRVDDLAATVHHLTEQVAALREQLEGRNR